MGRKMGLSLKQNPCLGLSISLTLVLSSHANPKLVPGVWTDISPSGASISKQGFLALAMDPTNPSTLYAGGCGVGIWKTLNGGESWTELGNVSQMGTNWATTTKYIDNPVFIEVDPENPKRLYSCHTGWCGSGQTQGFWISTDGGMNWEMPEGFKRVAGLPGSSTDVGGFVVDPGNFNHVLLSLHYTPNDQFGFLETTDGGATMVVHPYPTTVPAGTKGVTFLHSPKSGIGNESTWLVTTEQNGYWRTPDAGLTWANVAPTLAGVHGGLRDVHYTGAGMLYMGGVPYPTRSTDNGLTWQPVKNGLYGYYAIVIGDGKHLYASAGQSLSWSLESDGETWTENKKFPGTVGTLRYDTLNHILYSTVFSANGGVWALKVLDPGNGISRDAPNKRMPPAYGLQKPYKAIPGLSNPSILKSAGLHDTRGKRIAYKDVGKHVLIVEPE
jgi:hypothetical protein